MTRFDINDLVPERDNNEIAEDLKVSRRTIERWMKYGVNWVQAERFAVHILREHPASVFGEEWYRAAGYKMLPAPARRTLVA